MTRLLAPIAAVLLLACALPDATRPAERMKKRARIGTVVSLRETMQSTATIVSAPPLTFPPGPPPLSKNPIALLRYFLAFRRDGIGFVRGRFARYGDLYYSNFRGSHLYLMRHPDHMSEVLVAQGAKFQKTEKGLTARQLTRYLGSGLLTSNGELWRRQRRLINPAFNRRSIEAHGPAMVARTVRMLDGMREGSDVDLSREMMGLTLGIVKKVLFDHDSDGETDAVARAMTTFRQGASSPQLLADWLPLPATRRAKKALRDMDDIIYGMIDRRRAEPEEKLVARTDLLSLLIRTVDAEAHGERISRKQLRDELLTMFLAGHDTTSHMLTWTVYLLSQHPDVERRVTEEIDRALAGRLPTVEDLPAMPYAEQVLHEAMRLYPPAFVLSRTATEDATIGGFTIPAGAEVVMWTYLAHHDARWFPDPERFDPDRFTSERTTEMSKKAFIPFGAGTRTCIGKHFAMMEARLLLATMMQRARFELAPGHVVQMDPSVTLAPKGGMPMRVRLRS